MQTAVLSELGTYELLKYLLQDHKEHFSCKTSEYL